MDLQEGNVTTDITVYRVSDEGEAAIGIYLLILGWLSWLGNGVVILVLTKQLHTLQAQDFLTLNLAISDTGIAMFGYSRGIVEVFNMVGDDGYLLQTFWTCQVDGFLILLFGLISINTLTAISIVRYIKGCQPQFAHRLTWRNIFIVIGLIWANAIFWAGSPLLGWGSYKVRRYGTCEIDWVQARFSVAYRLYVILIFLFNFFVPVAVIVFTYVCIMRTVLASHRSGELGAALSERQRKIERGITQVSLLVCAAFQLAWSPYAVISMFVVSLLVCAAFLLAWSPYAVISMWSALGHNVPPLNGLVAALFAKSASFYNPFIYMGLSAKFRSDLRELFPFRCPRWKRGAGLQLRCPAPRAAGGEESSAKEAPRPGGSLAPNSVHINLDRFKEPIPEDEGRVMRLGVGDSGVEIGRSSTGSTAPLVKREAGVGGEREDPGRKVTGGDKQQEQEEEEEEEEQREETDCLRSPLVTYSTPAPAPAPHTYSHTYSQMYSHAHPHSHTQPQRGFIRRQSNSGRL